LKPHKVEGWLNRKTDDPEEFQKQSEKVCQAYWNAPAPAAAEQPTHTVSVDEKTGVQALKRAAPDLPMQPGHCAKEVQWQNLSDGHARECHSKNKQNTKPDPPPSPDISRGWSF